MTRRFVLRPAAAAELAESIEWYEARSKGLGGDFLRAVEAAFANIARNPAAYAAVHGKKRRAPVRRFPFSIMYMVSEQEILVVACFHTHRDPQRWKSRA